MPVVRTAVALVLLLAAVASPVFAAPAGYGGPKGPVHWTFKSTGLPDDPYTAVAVDPFDDQVIFVGLDGFLFRSDDGGDSWAAILSFPRGLVEDGLSDSVAAGIDESGGPAVGKVGASIDDDDDDAAAFDNPDANPDADDPNTDDLNVADDSTAEPDDSADDLPVGSKVDVAADDAGDAADLSIPSRTYPGVRTIAFVPGRRGFFFVATPRGLYRTIDNGKTFIAVPVPGGGAPNDIRDVVVYPEAPSRILLATAAGLFISENSGATLERMTGSGVTLPVVCLATVRIGAETFVAVGTEAGLFRSHSAGEDANVFTPLLLQGAAIAPVVHAVAFSNDGAFLYAGTGEGLYAAERSAPILERYAGVPPVAPTSISVDPRAGNVVAIAVARRSNSVVFSNDGGLTTTELDTLPAPTANGLARETKDPDRLWAVSDRGLFRLEKGTGIKLSRDQMIGMRERFEREPRLEDVIDEALAHSGFARDESQFTRVRWAAALPRLQVRFDAAQGIGQIQQEVFFFDDPTIIVDDENTDVTDGLAVLTPSDYVLWRLTVQLNWDLDRLILNPDESAVFRQHPNVIKAEDALVDRVAELYIARRRLLAEMEFGTDKSTGKKALLDDVRRQLKLQEIEALLASILGKDVFDLDPVPQEKP